MSLAGHIRRALALPAFCAPMTLISRPELVCEAAKAGVMAGIPRHNARSREEFETWLQFITVHLSRFAEKRPQDPIGPIAVNLMVNLSAEETKSELELLGRYGIEVVISAAGDPTEIANQVHDWGGLIFHDVTSMRYVEKAIQAGVDGLICVGSGGGGHSGLLSPLAMIPRIRAIFDGTIVMAGAVSTGAGIRAAEILGADLAYLGTRFIATKESAAPEAYKAMLVGCSADDLVYTPAIGGVACNWLKESLIINGLDPDELPVARQARDYSHLPVDVRPWRDIWSAGQGVELISSIPSVAELVERLKIEYARACALPSF